MTYSAGNTILDDDYNGFKDSVNGTNATGATTQGYGQPAVAAVSAGSTITATQWVTLLTPISEMASHQGTTITAITNPVLGDTIAAYAALSSNITAVTGDNRFNAAASGNDGSVSSVTTATWTTSATLTKTFTFASTNQLRYFFNAGGMLRFSWSRSGGTSNSQNTAWTNLFNACGVIALTGDANSKSIASVSYTGTTKIGGSGSPSTLRTDLGLQNFTTSTVLFAQAAAGVGYTTNNISFAASISGAVVTIVTTLSDGSGGFTDSVDGTLTQVSTIRNPSSTHLTASWGTVTQNSPTWTTS
jgi:hypothetical protein